jgi:hypothetical protein
MDTLERPCPRPRGGARLPWFEAACSKRGACSELPLAGLDEAVEPVENEPGGNEPRSTVP